MQRRNPVVFAVIDQSEGMMKTVIRFSVICTLLLMFLTADRSQAWACTCIANMPLYNTLVNSTAIFSGKVIRQDSPATFGLENWYLSVETVEVTNIWKGPTNRTLVVANSVCGFPFEVGKEYLIFAWDVEGMLVTGSCSETQAIETAEAQMALLTDLFASPQAPATLPATITTRGYSNYLAPADYFWVYFRFAQVQPEQSFDEYHQPNLVAALTEYGITQEMIDFGPYQDRNGVQFAVRLEKLPSYDLAAFLKGLPAAQESLSKVAGALIDRVEVRFSLADCTQAAWNGQRTALTDARQRAEILTGVLGGRVGAITHIVDIAERLPLTAQEYIECGAVKTGTWHPLPLEEDLTSATLLQAEAAVEVTFMVEKAVSGTQTLPKAAGEVSAVAKPTIVSPLPTPTVTPIVVSVLQTPEPPK